MSCCNCSGLAPCLRCPMSLSVAVRSDVCFYACNLYQTGNAVQLRAGCCFMQPRRWTILYRNCTASAQDCHGGIDGGVEQLKLSNSNVTVRFMSDSSDVSCILAAPAVSCCTACTPSEYHVQKRCGRVQHIDGSSVHCQGSRLLAAAVPLGLLWA
jgi:hypothetical protein